MRNSQSAIRNSLLASLLLVALLTATPLWGPGIVNTRGGGDSPFLLQRSQQMLVNLQAGIFPVRWMPDAAYGLGYPFFSYYAALPYYLVGLLGLLGIDLLTALKLVQTLGLVTSALAMNGWMRRVTRSQWAAWLGAVAYTVAPFHLVNIYVRGDSLSEFYAFVFYPLVLWTLDRLLSPSARPTASGPRFILAALAYAGLILTHQHSALIFSPFVLLYLLVLVLRSSSGRGRALALGLSSLAAGVLLATWYWLPALAELNAVQLGPSTEGYFHYSNHFRSSNLVQRGLLFNYSIAPDGTGRTPFAMSLAQAAFALLGALLLTARAVRRRITLRWGFILAGLLLSTAMITPLSRPLWDHLPLLPVVQFPWRFLSVQALFAAAATAALVPLRSSSRARRPHPALVALPIALLLAASTLLLLHPDRLPITSADVTVERLQLYELFTANIGSTIRSEWLPRETVPRPFTSDALVEPGAPLRAIPLHNEPLTATLVTRRPTEQTWLVQGSGGEIALPLLYWPGWVARVDGEPSAAWAAPGLGYLALAVPPGPHTVTLRLTRTPVRAAAEVVSLLAAVLLLFLVGRAATRQPATRNLLPAVLAVCLLTTSNLQPETCNLQPETCNLKPETCSLQPATSTMDFEQIPYLHSAPGGVDLGAVRLREYQFSAEELEPGAALTVTLHWEVSSGGPYTATLRLTTPAATRHEVAPLAVSAARLGPGEAPVTRHTIPLPDDLPRGLYLLQLRLAGPQGEVAALTSGGRTRGPLYLCPLRVPHGPPAQAETLAPFGPSIRLHSLTATQPRPDRLDVRLAWSATAPLPTNYNLSLRLLDGSGNAVAALDTQPGYGYLPTSQWLPGELVTDGYLLPIPGDLPRGDYRLQVVLYRVDTLQAVGQGTFGGLSLPRQTEFAAATPPRSFARPDLAHPLGVELGDEISLAGYDLLQRDNELRLTLWWQALAAPLADYTVFVHLFDPADETLAAQQDSQPRQGEYPTSWWAAGEVVSETVVIPLAGVPPGEYRLGVGMYDREVRRLTAVAPDGTRLPADRVVLPPTVVVAEP